MTSKPSLGMLYRIQTLHGANWAACLDHPCIALGEEGYKFRFFRAYDNYYYIAVANWRFAGHLLCVENASAGAHVKRCSIDEWRKEAQTDAGRKKFLFMVKTLDHGVQICSAANTTAGWLNWETAEKSGVQYKLLVTRKAGKSGTWSLVEAAEPQTLPETIEAPEAPYWAPYLDDLKESHRVEDFQPGVFYGEEKPSAVCRIPYFLVVDPRSQPNQQIADSPYYSLERRLGWRCVAAWRRVVGSPSESYGYFVQDSMTETKIESMSSTTNVTVGANLGLSLGPLAIDLQGEIEREIGSSIVEESTISSSEGFSRTVTFEQAEEDESIARFVHAVAYRLNRQTAMGSELVDEWKAEPEKKAIATYDVSWNANGSESRDASARDRVLLTTPADTTTQPLKNPL